MELKKSSSENVSFQSITLSFPSHFRNPIAPRAMQDNWYFYYSGCQESSDSHHSEIAPVNSATSNATPVLAYTGDPIDLQEWPAAVAPSIGNSNGSLTGVSAVAENSGYAAHASRHEPASNRAPISFASYGYSTDAHSAPWSAAAAVTADAHAPQTAWNERSAAFTQLDGSQVPSGLTYLDVQRSDSYHAVGAPIQPTFLRDTDYFRNQIPVWSYLPAFPEVSATSTIQVHSAGLGNVNPCAAVHAPGQVPSPSNRRRSHRPPHAPPERVNCDRCNKRMRRQSLRRHVREVHDHIKRPHSQSSFSARP